MTASRRRKTPDRSSKLGRRQLADDLGDDGGEELPVLEPELAEEPVASPIAVAVNPATEADFDTEVVLDVPEMDKKAVADAVVAPLRRAADAAAPALRHRRVLVRFSGETLISSAAKDVVGQIMATTRALKVVLRRGYGDELLHEGKLPQVTIESRVDGDAVLFTIDCGDLDADDLAAALQLDVQKLTAPAKGKTLAFTFKGAAPSAEARSLLRAELLAAGAVRARVGEQVLFDRELEARVKLASSSGSAAVQVTPADDEDTTLAALDLVLAPNAAQLTGRKVFVEFLGRRARGRELARLVEICRSAQPARAEIAAESGEPDQMWPPLLEVAASGDGVELTVVDAGRSKGGLAASFAREVGTLRSRLLGKDVTVAWPAGFDLDAKLEAGIVEALGAARPRTVACTFGSGEREPFLPPPLTRLPDAAGGRRLRLHTDAGKPPELARAIERRLRVDAPELRGQVVRVELSGAGTTSRGMLRALAAGGERAGIAVLEVEDRGVVDRLLPPMLAITRSPAGVRVAADPEGRTPAQVELALARELDGAEFGSEALWTIARSPLERELVAAAVALGAGRVVLEGDPPLPVHPPLLNVARAGDRTTVRAAPGDGDEGAMLQLEYELPRVLAEHADWSDVTVLVVWPGARLPLAGAAATLVERLVQRSPRAVLLDAGRGRARQVFPPVVPDYVTVLGRRDDPAASMIMLGIDRGEGEDHASRVQAKLEALAGSIDGRRVLLVARDEGELEVAVADRDPLLATVRTFVDARAAATLAFRGLDARRRPYFEVVHSRVDDLKVGSRFADPRAGRKR